jgi:hypothetical protein
MAGVYFKVTESSSELAGYLRAGGNLNVLGLIHVNVEFLLMVTYQKRSDGSSELYGKATLTISIEMLFFSIDVHVTFEKRIAGSSQSGGEGGGHARSGRVLPFGRTSDAVVSSDPNYLPEPTPGARSVGPLEPPPALDRCYFQRDDVIRPGSAGRGTVRGRFAWDDRRPSVSASRWVSEYWSQFDFSRN